MHYTFLVKMLLKYPLWYKKKIVIKVILCYMLRERIHEDELLMHYYRFHSTIRSPQIDKKISVSFLYHNANFTLSSPSNAVLHETLRVITANKHSLIADELPSTCVRGRYKKPTVVRVRRRTQRARVRNRRHGVDRYSVAVVILVIDLARRPLIATSGVRLSINDSFYDNR